MSKLTVRVIFSVLISLGIIFAIFTSVQGASPNVLKGKAGSGAMVNLNHYRPTSSESSQYQGQLDTYNDPSTGGHGCEDEVRYSPDDY
jgi:hypothetical protein